MPEPVDASVGSLDVFDDGDVLAEVTGAEVVVVDVVGQLVVVVVVAEVGAVVDVVDEVVVEGVGSEVVVEVVDEVVVDEVVVDDGVVVEVVDVGVLDVVVDVGGIVELVGVVVGQFAVVVEVVVEVVEVVEDVVVAPVLPVLAALAGSVPAFAVDDAPVLPVLAALAVSGADSAVDDAAAMLPPAGDPSEMTAPRRVNASSAPTPRARNLIEPPPIAMLRTCYPRKTMCILDECPEGHEKMNFLRPNSGNV